MKTFLYDLTNFGLIYVTDTKDKVKTNWEISIFKSCILDIGSSMISPKSSVYNDLSNDAISTKFFVLNRDYLSTVLDKVNLGNPEEINDVFLAKQKKAQLIAPLIILLTDAITRRSLNKLVNSGFPIDDTLAHELSKCNIDENIYSVGVTEYAKTLGITAQQAYIELKLEYESAHSIKMRSYALTRKYQSLIREVNTEEDAQLLKEEIIQKLLRETYI